jgi:hypothetical protein
MKGFDPKFFRKVALTPEEGRQYYANALRDLKIARDDKFLEVKFTYAYQALFKAGVALVAVKGKHKVRSVPGHHVEVLKALSRLLDDPDVFDVGNAMRMKRNLDLYGPGGYVSEKEAADYMTFVAGVVKKVGTLIGA